MEFWIFTVLEVDKKSQGFEMSEETERSPEEHDRLSDELESRRHNLELLRKWGIDPWGSRFMASHAVDDLHAEFDDTDAEELEKDTTEVALGGRLMAFRSHGKACFGDLLDSSGSIQVFFRFNELSERPASLGSEFPSQWDLLDAVNLGDWIGVSGTLLYANKASIPLLKDWDSKVGKLLPKEWRDRVLTTFDSGAPSETEVKCQDRVISLTIAPVVKANYANLYGLDITERKQADEVKSLALRISQATNTSSDLYELLQTINTELSTLIDTANFYVSLYDEATNLYSFPFFVDERMAAEDFAPQDLTGSLTDYVRRTGKPLFGDEETQQRLREAGEAKMVGAPSPMWLGAPLETPRGVIGVVAVQSYTDKDHYSMKDLELMSLASGNIAMAIERKRGQDALQESYKKLEKAMRGTIDAMARTAETRDPYTAGHQKRVAALSREIARKMKLPEDQIGAIHMAAMIHDLGKINVPAEILSKPGELTELEVDLIRIHPKVGYEILKEIDFPWPIAEIVLQHHERLDGSGYPEGKSGDEVLLEARILGLADVVEAISSHRPYRSALGVDRALNEIKANRGILYDPKVVDVCVEILTDESSDLDW